MQGQFRKNFRGPRRGCAGIAGPSAPSGPAMPLSARGGHAAVLPSGALGTSRIQPPAVFRFRGAGFHSLNGYPAGAGHIIGANRAPARSAISKLGQITGLVRELPSMP